MDGNFLQERIALTKAMIVAYEDALLALSANPTEKYKLDTGQSVTEVSRSDYASLQTALDGLYNRLATMCARLNGGGSTHGRPSW